MPQRAEPGGAGVTFAISTSDGEKHSVFIVTPAAQQAALEKAAQAEKVQAREREMTLKQPNPKSIQGAGPDAVGINLIIAAGKHN
jgi:hypothetical protein